MLGIVLDEVGREFRKERGVNRVMEAKGVPRRRAEDCSPLGVRVSRREGKGTSHSTFPLYPVLVTGQTLFPAALLRAFPPPSEFLHLALSHCVGS